LLKLSYSRLDVEFIKVVLIGPCYLLLKYLILFAVYDYIFPFS
jgi:hypothetical protein